MRLDKNCKVKAKCVELRKYDVMIHDEGSCFLTESLRREFENSNYIDIDVNYHSTKKIVPYFIIENDEDSSLEELDGCFFKYKKELDLYRYKVSHADFYIYIKIYEIYD